MFSESISWSTEGPRGRSKYIQALSSGLLTSGPFDNLKDRDPPTEKCTSANKHIYVSLQSEEIVCLVFLKFCVFFNIHIAFSVPIACERPRRAGLWVISSFWKSWDSLLTLISFQRPEENRALPFVEWFVSSPQHTNKQSQNSSWKELWDLVQLHPSPQLPPPSIPKLSKRPEQCPSSPSCELQSWVWMPMTLCFCSWDHVSSLQVTWVLLIQHLRRLPGWTVASWKVLLHPLWSYPTWLVSAEPQGSSCPSPLLSWSHLKRDRTTSEMSNMAYSPPPTSV